MVQLFKIDAGDPCRNSGASPFFSEGLFAVCRRRCVAALRHWALFVVVVVIDVVVSVVVVVDVVVVDVVVALACVLLALQYTQQQYVNCSFQLRCMTKCVLSFNCYRSKIPTRCACKLSMLHVVY